ncbi:hypothetical protein NBH00_02945 [Paraconexibacter antarcticus]|uniref:Uncharacterized protein n=1 Tax=Paraconexibacter antarcticus TaxID=2949664 RepID=A0ABY5DWZ9_9ACTN|nr:hypothetical protein [Paraconexibacter antarcticus]UTI65175.1 hypothetical protein NBH00_02945 [Paraconexibacter antarcticus]
MSVSFIRLRQALRRRRRPLTAACVVLALGVIAHHAMPEGAMGDAGHGTGDHGAMATMVMCLGVIAAAGLWAVSRLPRLRPRTRPVLLAHLRPRSTDSNPLVIPRARAGPLGPVVLRI